jgi:opacity protein-like surface antigen
MGGVRTFALAAATALMSTATLAADLPPPLPPMPQYIPPAPIVDTGGWYLRGDVGVGMTRAGRLQYLPNPANPVTDFAIEHSAFGDTAFAGFGVGYSWNNWFRFDVTAEYRNKASFNAWGSYTIGCPGGICLDVYQGFMKSYVVLANAYLDLGTWWCLTPFIGVGFGGAGNTITGFSDFGPQTGGRGFAADRATWNLAWAGHAGLAYTVTNSFKVEFAYRYLSLGTASAAINCIGGCNADSYRFKNINSQDFKIGLRWALQPEPVYVPPPIYTPPPPLMRRG